MTKPQPQSQPKRMTIDFVSDVVCPWCIIGLNGLEQALDRVGDLVTADIHFQPFELNPNMPPGGQNIREHVAEKYGSTPEQSASARVAIRDRAAGVGFTMAMKEDSRIYNTFDAHRLLHWAGLPDHPGADKQSALKHALFDAYFTHGRNPADHKVLADAAKAAGLDPIAARQVLESDAYAQEVREAEKFWHGRGISAVPAVIIDGKYIISGGQPPEMFERALRSIAAESPQAAS
jgi:predicted DsbA family dithiol-disulfide isomerase